MEAPTTEAEIEKIATELDGHTVPLNWLEDGRIRNSNWRR
jgi:hypothetical protein